MKQRIISILQILFFLSLGLGLIYWRYTAMSDDSRSAMSQAFAQIKWWVLAPIAVVGFLSHYFRALRWKILLQTVDIHPSTSNTTFAVLIGYLANTVVPRLGEITKCTVLARYERIRPERALGTIIGERAFDTLSLLALIGLILILERSQALTLWNLYLGNMLGNWSEWPWTLIFIAIGALVALFLALKGLLPRFRERKAGRIVFRLIEGVSAIWRLKNRSAFLLYSIAIWLMYILMVYLGYYALDATSHLSFRSAMAIVAFGSIGMIVTPGGVGAYPLIVAAVLSLYGINEGVGMAFGWICWGTQTVLILMLGIISLILLPIFNGKHKSF